MELVTAADITALTGAFVGVVTANIAPILILLGTFGGLAVVKKFVLKKHSV